MCIKCYIIFGISVVSLDKFEIMNFLKQRIWKNKQKVLILDGVQRGLTRMIKGCREIDLWRKIKGPKYVYCRLPNWCIRRNMITVFKYLTHVNTTNREEMNIWVNFRGGKCSDIKVGYCLALVLPGKTYMLQENWSQKVRFIHCKICEAKSVSQKLLKNTVCFNT